MFLPFLLLFSHLRIFKATGRGREGSSGAVEFVRIVRRRRGVGEERHGFQVRHNLQLDTSTQDSLIPASKNLPKFEPCTVMQKKSRKRFGEQILLTLRQLPPKRG